MGGDDRAAPGADPSSDGGHETQPGGLQRVMKTVFDRTPWGRRLNRHAESVRDLREQLGRVEARLDITTDRIEARLDRVEDALRSFQSELAGLRDQRFPTAEIRLDAVEASVTEVSGDTTRLRDDVIPVVVRRSDALLERLASELEELGSLVERMLRREPLPVPDQGAVEESRLAAALAEVQPALLEAFRGSETEVRHRLDRYLDALTSASPVLDLGCGRGELLLMLREAGVEATGIEGDSSMAQAARRRGLDVIEADVHDALRAEPDSSRGAVTAIHLLEHLDAAEMLAMLAEVRRVLRPGGVLIAESPNPHSLRVGGALFWLDPTHRRPLLPESLELYLRASGFVVERRELLHPFPSDQLFSTADDGIDLEDPVSAALAVRIDSLSRRLDELVNGPRDFVVWAKKPT
jgi:SAM-dependent methyltransferase